MSDLFRTEAVAHATRRLTGTVVLASSTSMWALTTFAVTVVICGTIFLATATYTRKETVSGWLTPPAGMIRLPAAQGGIVEHIAVVEGQYVAIGEPLATLRLSPALTAGDAFSSLSASLATRRGAAHKQAAARRDALLAERTQLSDRRGHLAQELAETRRRLELQRQRLSFANAEVTRAETIAAGGFLPRRELEARRSAALETEQVLSEIASQALSYERQIADVSARLSAIPIDLRALAAEASSVSAGLEQERTETEAQSSYLVVATTAGRVAALPVTRGQSVPTGATIAVITAGNGPLEAELYAPSRAAGFIKKGQEVRLMFQAFPHQKFGTGRGLTTSVSPTVFAPSDISVQGLRITEPVFRVRVALSKESVDAYGQTLPLQPGMLLTADVILDRRTLLEWLLDPLYAAGRRG